MFCGDKIVDIIYVYVIRQNIYTYIERFNNTTTFCFTLCVTYYVSSTLRDLFTDTFVTKERNNRSNNVKDVSKIKSLKISLLKRIKYFYEVRFLMFLLFYLVGFKSLCWLQLSTILSKPTKKKTKKKREKP